MRSFLATIIAPVFFLFLASLVLLGTWFLANDHLRTHGVTMSEYDKSHAKNWAELGTRGDFYGGFGNVGVGLAGTILFFGALVLQSNELRLQRRELQETQAIAARQADAQEEQIAELRRQTATARLRDEFDLVYRLCREDLTRHGQDTYGTTGFVVKYILAKQKVDEDAALELCTAAYAGCSQHYRPVASAFASAVSRINSGGQDNVPEEFAKRASARLQGRL